MEPVKLGGNQVGEYSILSSLNKLKSEFFMIVF